MISNTSFSDERAERAAAVFRRHRRLKAAQYADLAGLGRTQAVADLNMLVEAGVVERVGGGRSTVYRLVDGARDDGEKPSAQIEEKIHPWRLCPGGQHWVVTHPMGVPSGTTTRHGHCARNPSGKDQLYPGEIRKISEAQFADLKHKPCPLDLGFPRGGARYDDLVGGWVQYWNDVLSNGDPLDPNLVKALIASESRFDPNLLANKKNSNSARGLMQIQNGTRTVLGDEHGELKNHFVTATKEELNDPDINICAGVRWLFWKRERASAKLGRAATWEQGVAEYKGVLKDWNLGKPKGTKNMAPFLKYLKEARACGKS